MLWWGRRSTAWSDRGRLYGSIGDVAVRVDSVETELLAKPVSSGFTRYTTQIVLRGGGHVGYGEDVTYEEEVQQTLPQELGAIDVTGAYRLDELSLYLEALLPAEGRYYSRWGLESAALDLALRQSGTTFPSVFGRTYAPLRFVVSTRLGSPPSADILLGWLSRYPELEFKLDPQSSWTDELMDRVAATGRVRIVDLKGAYVGTPVDQPFDEDLYRRVVDAFPDAYIEDPAPTPVALDLLSDVRDRLSWDAVIHSAADISNLAYRPGAINIKPSRFGTVRRLLDAIEFCLDNDIPMYGGGQFELGRGRAQIQAVASVFYPGGPNDVAPQDFNHGRPRSGLPASPLVPREESAGFTFSA